MSIRENKFPIQRVIQPQHVLMSAFDKTDLDVLVRDLLDINPEVIFYSTGGTGKIVQEVLGDAVPANYISVEQFIDFPEMDGGLVKTLHPKIHAGLLGERGNPKHAQYLEDLRGGVYFDILVGSLYPFENVVASPDVTPEQARVNIDVGGPTMIRAAGKNWHSVAVVTGQHQYGGLINHLRENGGISPDVRFGLAQQALAMLAVDATEVSTYFNGLDYERDVKPGLNFEDANLKCQEEQI